MDEYAEEVERIIIKYENGEMLSYTETETFCMNCFLNSKSYDSLPKICIDFKFEKLYKVYYEDLSFNSEYKKPNYSENQNLQDLYRFLNQFNEEQLDKDLYENDSFENIINFITNKYDILRKVTKEEIENDKKFLEYCAVEWSYIITKTTHSDQRLQIIGKEARDLKKIIEKEYRLNKINLFEKDYQLKLLFWKTKYIHLTVVKILEEIGKDSYEIYLNNKTIIFNYTSLIHILNRHYSQITSIQSHKETKSFHHPIFQPNNIHINLEKIFSKFNQLSEFKNEKIVHNKPLNFKYRKINYQLFLKLFGDKKDKLFISSLYPIENSEEINKLSQYKFIEIDNELGIYL